MKLASKTADQYVLSMMGSTGSSAFKLMYQASSDKWYATLSEPQADGTAAWTNCASAAGQAPISTWVHLTATIDPATGALTLYVNGVQACTTTVALPFTNQATSLYLGNQSTSGFLDGQLSDVQVYQRALSASQTGDVYSGAAPASTAGVAKTSYGLDNGGLVLYSIDAAGNRTDYTYDADGKQAVVIGPAVMAETGGGAPTLTRPISYFGYDTFGETVEAEDANGNVTVNGYDANGNTTSTQLPAYTVPGTATVIHATTREEFDAMGRRTASYDALGNKTSYSYDQLSDVSKVTTPDLHSTTYTYDQTGRQLSVTDPAGAVATQTYNNLYDKLDTTTDVVSQTSSVDTTHYFYDSAGRLARTTTPDGVDARSSYNAAGEVTETIDGANNVTSFTYDGRGNVIKTTSPDGTYTTTDYDTAGQPLSASNYDANGTLLSRVSHTYDNNGNVLTSTDARGTTTTFTYDPTGIPTSETQPISSTDSITTTFGYDLTGNLTRFTDGRGNAFITTYNVWNLPESQIEPATPSQPNPADGTFTTAYDADGRVATQTSPGGVVVTNTYDNMGNLTTAHGAGADAATTDRTFGYDADGRITSASGGAGTDTFSYDDRGLLTNASGASGTSSFGYNADGAMTSRVDAAGTTSYGYDAGGRLASVTNTGTGVDASIAYNVMNEPSTITYANNDVRTFGYDGQHRLSSDVLKTASNATVASIAYGYDANSNETSKTTTGFTGSAANTYTYDLANRLTSWSNGTTTTDYAYDKSGNRTRNGSKVFTYDARNQLQDMNGSTFYHYTARGSLASTQTPTGTQNTTTDAFGQTITQDASSGQTQTYSYDALGRVIQPGMSYTGVGNTLASDGATSYTRDPSDALIGEASAGTNCMVWTDQHTDVVAQFASDGTALAGSVTYDPLGNVVTGTGMIGHLGFQSEWTDSLTGRVNMAARWYNPDTGQFDSRDSASNNAVPASVAADRYAYGNDNPLTVTDPSGHYAYMLLDGIAPISHFTHARHYRRTPPARHHTTALRSTHNKPHRINDARPTRSGACIRVEGMDGPCANRINTPAGQQKLKSIAKRDAQRSREEAAYERHVAAYKAWLNSSIGRRTGEAEIAAGAAASNARHKKALEDGLKAQESKPAHCGTFDFICQAKKAAHSVGHFIDEHKAAIVGIAVAVGVGSICTIATFGMGAVGCAVVAGAVGGALGNMASQGVECADKGGDSCSGSAFLTAGVTGAVGGAVGALAGPIGGRIAGKVLGSVGKSVISRVAGGAISGALAGGASGAATGAVGYGIGCLSGSHCSAAGLGKAVMSGAEGGAEFGAVSGGLSALGCHSFDPSTPVVMADGTTKPIKDVTVGDKVTSTDPVTGKTFAEPVIQLHINHDTDLADVTVNNTKTGKTTVLHTTWHHPFWNADTKTWTEAKDLTAGTHLRDIHGKTTIIVTGIKTWTGLHWMRDLTVNTIHTYYVIAGETPVLVHNCGGGGAGDNLLRTNGAGAGKKLPMTMECVCQIAEKYGIDISGVNIKIDKSKIGYYGSTAPNQTITLTRSAFSNEEQLARTLAHERYHVDQIRSGMGYPTDYDSGNIWESTAQTYEDNWWDTIGSGLR